MKDLRLEELKELQLKKTIYLDNTIDNAINKAKKIPR